MLHLPPSKTDQAKKGVILSIGVCSVFAVLKCWLGIWAHSQAVFADGLNNFSDILLSVGIFVSLIVAGRPADHNHPFGHNKAENIAAFVTAFVMVIVALRVWIESVDTLWNHTEKTVHSAAIYLSLASSMIMFLLSRINFRLSEKTNSQALRANAYDNRSDSFVSMGAALGGIGSLYGWVWMDPLAAIFVGGIILHTAYKIGRPAVDSLMDGFDQKKMPRIKERVMEIEGIHDVREIRARNHGPYVFVEVTIGVDENLTVRESHELTEKIEKKLKGFEHIEHVHVHVEPILFS